MGSLISRRGTRIDEVSLPGISTKKICWEARRFILENNLPILISRTCREIQTWSDCEEIRDIWIDVESRLPGGQIRQRPDLLVRREGRFQLRIKGGANVIHADPSRIHRRRNIYTRP